MLTANPAPRFPASKRCPSPNSNRNRSRVADSPTPRPNTSVPNGAPGPSSVTSSCSMLPTRVACTSIAPPAVCDAFPCRMAFSTSGCNRRDGARASSASGVAFDADAQPVAEACAHEPEVAVEHLELVAQRNLVRMRRAQRKTKQLGQLADHAIRTSRIVVHRGRDRIERVEQEVRLELEPEIAQLRLRESSLQLRRPNLALPGGAIVSVQGDDDDERRITDGIRPEFHHVARRHVPVVVLAHAARIEDRRAAQVKERRVR